MVEQKQSSADHRQHYEMCGMTSEAQHRRTHRKNCITCCRGNPCGRIHQFSTQKKNERHSCGVYQKQAQMNSSDCLSEDRHDQSVSSIGSRKLHVVSQFVRVDALQHELTGISVFAFVALKW